MKDDWLLWAFAAFVVLAMLVLGITTGLLISELVFA